MAEEISCKASTPRRLSHETSGHFPTWSLETLLQRLRSLNTKQDDKLAHILDVVGEFGTFQRRLVALTFIPISLSAFFIFVDHFVFTAQKPYCNTSWILAVGPNLSEAEQLNLTLPREPNGSFLTCLMYLPVNWNLDSIIHFGLNDTVSCQDGWIYPDAQERSLINEFDLVCDKEFSWNIVQAILWSGILIGSIIFGFLSDRLGRYPCILLSLLGLIIFGFGTAFVKSFRQYLFFRFGVSQAVTGYLISSVSLASEWLGGEHRAHAIILENCFFTVGLMFLTGLAYSLHHWRLLFLVGGAPTFPLIAYIWILPESPRWLMMKGKTEEAKKVLRYAAYVNKKTIPVSLLNKLHLSSKKVTEASVLDFYSNNYLRKFVLVMVCVWFAIGYNYCLLSTQRRDFSTSIYFTTLIPSIMKLPARLGCIFLLEQVGRKRSLIFTFFQGSLLCFISLLIHPGKDAGLALNWPSSPQRSLCLTTELKSMYTLLVMLGEFSLIASFTVLLAYSTELLPTVLRSTGLGLVTLALAAGVIMCLTFISHDQNFLPSFLCCFSATLALLLCNLLPETRNQPLFDSLEHLPTLKKSLSLEMTDDLTSDDMTEVAKNTFLNATMENFNSDSISSMRQTYEDTVSQAEEAAD
ncbi:PREDICTED: solute carrier family 22 member 14 [Condylura cristata]|uniref:solute carrier family 22 member 14 n=1 Tax=Condylura cristata TaxID=143302 RepID=UPI0003345B93|nr:PREDICTED: solute carrier family 22 member 14 [Condylura cristata]